MPKHKTKGPISLLGAPSKVASAAPGQRAPVRCVVRARVQDEDMYGLPAGLNFSAWPAATQDVWNGGDPAGGNHTSSDAFTCFIQLARGSDCVLCARYDAGGLTNCRHDAELPPGEILLDEAQRHNLRVAAGEAYDWSVFQPPAPPRTDGKEAAPEMPNGDQGGPHAPFELVELTAEARVMRRTQSWDASSSGRTCGVVSSIAADGEALLEVDGPQLASLLGKRLFNRIVAMNEYIVLPMGDLVLLVRVTHVDSMSEAERESEASLGYHCFRGLVTPTTAIYLASADEGGIGGPSVGPFQATGGSGDGDNHVLIAASHPTGGCSGVNGDRIRHVQVEPEPKLTGANGGAEAAGATHLGAAGAATSSGLQVVRDTGEAAPSVTVPVGTLTFDRVLIFLEALALGRDPPSFAQHLLPALTAAAEALGCRQLQEAAGVAQGARHAARRAYTFAEVQRANAAGSCWLILDGMVLDVGRWLPEHPGGQAIIPAQALNNDCARFFEMYHASRESFLYLSSFYLGEVIDRSEVPLGGGEQPSTDFLAQLRDYTLPFRLAGDVLAAAAASVPTCYKSF